MQLRKDDVKTEQEIKHGSMYIGEAFLNFSKFQQVVDFYDTHQLPWTLKKDESEWFVEWKEYYEKKNLEDDDTLKAHYLYWLHNKCFKDGLK